MNPTMLALVQKHSGFARERSGPGIADLSDWIEARTIPAPRPGPGQVAIRLRAASVNPSDLHFIKGEYGQPREEGAPAGFEGCGDVISAGAGPQAAALQGKRVAFVAGPGGSGAWAEIAVADAASCIPLRPDITDADGAGQIVNPLTAAVLVGLERRGEGQAIVITAATSQLGKLIIGLCRDAGIATLAVIRRKSAGAALKELGATEVLAADDPRFTERAGAAMRALKPRLLLDAVGDEISARLFELAPARARWVVYGKLSEDAPHLAELGQMIFMGKRIEGFWLAEWLRDAPAQARARAIAECQDRFADGRWRTDIAASIPLDRAMKELGAALRLKDGKTILIPQETEAT